MFSSPTLDAAHRGSFVDGRRRSMLLNSGVVKKKSRKYTLHLKSYLHLLRKVSTRADDFQRRNTGCPFDHSQPPRQFRPAQTGSLPCVSLSYTAIRKQRSMRHASDASPICQGVFGQRCHGRLNTSRHSDILRRRCRRSQSTPRLVLLELGSPPGT